MDQQQKRYNDLLRLNRLKAYDQIIPFLSLVNIQYKANWHHHYIAEKIERFFADDSVKNLLLVVPPQFGKTEIASRALPAWLLGRSPNLKIVSASYSGSLSKTFSKDVQRYMSSDDYQRIFSKTKLAETAHNTSIKSEQSASQFDIVGYRGRYTAVGVTGALTGKTVDVGIIDDPIKDDIEASSSVYRERVWQWFTKVYRTRLHNDSKTILIQTRWHEDDLAGRILEKESDKWEVIHLRAIKTERCPKDDPREIGESLWEDRHSRAKIMDLKALNPSVFDNLYQGDPSNPDGTIILRDWIRYSSEPNRANLSLDIWIDGAYTEKTKNDPTGAILTAYQDNTLFVLHAWSAHLELPALIKRIKNYAFRQGLSSESKVKVEPKASGLSLIQMLRQESTLNVSSIVGELVKTGKTGRAQTLATYMEAGRVVLVRGSWNDEVVHQLTAFPKANHDEYLDLIAYAADYYLRSTGKGRGIRQTNMGR